MKRGEGQRLKRGAAIAKRTMILIAVAVGVQMQFTLLELFCGNGELSRLAASLDSWRVLQPRDIIFGDNLLDRELHREIY